MLNRVRASVCSTCEMIDFWIVGGSDGMYSAIRFQSFSDFSEPCSCVWNSGRYCFVFSNMLVRELRRWIGSVV